MRDLNKKITPKTILNIFNPDKLKFKEKFGDNKKVHVLKLMNEINSLYGIYERGDSTSYCLIVNFFRGEAGFKLYSYEPAYK